MRQATDKDIDLFDGHHIEAGSEIMREIEKDGVVIYSLQADFREQHRAIPWSELYGLRNRIVHDYEGVNLKLVWEIIENDLPELIRVLEREKCVSVK